MARVSPYPAGCQKKLNVTIQHQLFKRELLPAAAEGSPGAHVIACTCGTLIDLQHRVSANISKKLTWFCKAYRKQKQVWPKANGFKTCVFWLCISSVRGPHGHPGLPQQERTSPRGHPAAPGGAKDTAVTPCEGAAAGTTDWEEKKKERGMSLVAFPEPAAGTHPAGCTDPHRTLPWAGDAAVLFLISVYGVIYKTIA